MKLGIVAAGAIEEISAGRALKNSPNLRTLLVCLEGEPAYDPLRHFRRGDKSEKLAALGYCCDLALADGVLVSN